MSTIRPVHKVAPHQATNHEASAATIAKFIAATRANWARRVYKMNPFAQHSALFGGTIAGEFVRVGIVGSDAIVGTGAGYYRASSAQKLRAALEAKGTGGSKKPSGQEAGLRRFVEETRSTWQRRVYVMDPLMGVKKLYTVHAGGQTYKLGVTPNGVIASSVGGFYAAGSAERFSHYLNIKKA